jgi:hypothetical protein
MKRNGTLCYASLLPLLLVMACGDSDLQKVAKALTVTAKSISMAQTTVIEANKQKLISDDDTAAILKVCLEVNRAGKDATAITRGLAQLDQPSRSQLLTILIPVIRSIGDAVTRTSLIKDAQTQTNIKGILLTVQTTLTSIQLILAGG